MDAHCVLQTHIRTNSLYLACAPEALHSEPDRCNAGLLRRQKEYTHYVQSLQNNVDAMHVVRGVRPVAASTITTEAAARNGCSPLLELSCRKP